jgi:O-antigen ligase
VLLLASVWTAFARPRDFPMFLAVYLPYNYAYPMQFGTGVNLTNALLLTAVVAWLRSRMDSRERIPLTFGDWAVAAYVMAGALGALHANQYEANPLGAALWDLKEWIRPFLFYYVTRGLLSNRRDLRGLAIVIFYSATLAGVSTWREGFDKAGSSIEKSRAGGPLAQPNQNGAFLVYYGAPMLGLFLLSDVRGVRRGLLALGFLVTARALLYTYSRGAYLAMAAASASMLFLRNPLFLAAVAVITWGGANAGLMPSAVTKRLGMDPEASVEIYDKSIEGNLDKSSRNRLVLWGAAEGMIRENPWQGVGLNRFAVSVDEYLDKPLPEDAPRDAHNAYLLNAAELGLGGATMMILNLAWPLALALYLYFSRRHPLDRGLALAFVGTSVGVMASCMFGSRFSEDGVIGYYWLMVAMLVVLKAQPREEGVDA